MSMGSVDTSNGNGTDSTGVVWGKIQLDIDALLQVKEDSNDIDIDGFDIDALLQVKEDSILILILMVFDIDALLQGA